VEFALAEFPAALVSMETFRVARIVENADVCKRTGTVRRVARTRRKTALAVSSERDALEDEQGSTAQSVFTLAIQPTAGLPGGNPSNGHGSCLM
jgi:hypothetical protein